jgi:hypothetical protein
MLDLAAASESLRQSRRSSLERLANSTSQRFALFGAAALAIFDAGQAATHQGTAGRPFPNKTPDGSLPRSAPELRP